MLVNEFLYVNKTKPKIFLIYLLYALMNFPADRKKK